MIGPAWSPVLTDVTMHACSLSARLLLRRLTSPYRLAACHVIILTICSALCFLPFRRPMESLGLSAPCLTIKADDPHSHAPLHETLTSAFMSVRRGDCPISGYCLDYQACCPRLEAQAFGGGVSKVSKKNMFLLVECNQRQAPSIFNTSQLLFIAWDTT